MEKKPFAISEIGGSNPVNLIFCNTSAPSLLSFFTQSELIEPVVPQAAKHPILLSRRTVRDPPP